ncbi:MAG: glycosyl hydrolase 115 family protein [Bacteroidales bacterium]|nr:glycosyl hydrolase 115 family protein [Bacteroidales bacterium]
MKNILFTALLLPQILLAQIHITKSPPKGKDYFPIVNSTTHTPVFYDSSDYKVVSIVSQLFTGDIEMISGGKPVILSGNDKLNENIIIIGTIGKNKLIDRLIAEKKLLTDSIKNQWECFIIQTIDKPFKGVQKALVIAGSDRRGTAYGVFTLSEKMGVSPWYWWADVPVKKSRELYLENLTCISKTPSVKYRGIFINDEDWGLHAWAAKNFEKELNDIGPKTYERVCELLLRLKGNMFAPAMHSCTGAFYQYPESKVVADQYGIIITTSHCEPLLFNNASKKEWDSKRDGEWNYSTNKDVILKKLDDRVKEASPFENIYTVGMRGLHDEGLRGEHSAQEKVVILTRVIADQQKILEKYLDKPADEIQQIFVPYKETMEIYEMGLEVPQDVTLVWVDDNYGYIKRLSNPEEQERSGGAGVYYHLSYLGPPHDYLWLNTTPPVLMYEELKKAYDVGADRYWLINVGDIKPAELGMQTFFDFTWNVEGYDITSINKHQGQYLESIFDGFNSEQLQYVMDTYYRLAWSRKPEFMGWEREWDRDKSLEQLANTEFSFNNYNDARQRLADYKKISDLVSEMLIGLAENYRPAFYQLVAYPVMGSYQMNRKFLLAQLNDELYKKKEYASANWAADEAKLAYDSINSLTTTYNTILNGKWNGMMELAPGLVAKYQNMPEVVYTENAGSHEINISPQQEQNRLVGCTVLDLRKFNNKVVNNKHTMRIIEGIGFDGYAIQLGKATEQTVDPTDLNGSHFEYEFSGVENDSVTVYIYSLPLFPLYKGRSNKFGISIDGQPIIVAINEPKEFSKQWKDQVLRNSVVTKAEFPINKETETHTLTLTCGDPGAIIQRVVIDWGGLKETYVGPSVNLTKQVAGK